MLTSREQLAEIEAAAVRSWPALETADVDGWVWRFASGGSLRANSVSTLSFSGIDADAAVRDAERRYRAKGAPCRFTITEVSQPGDLDARLAAMGYERGEDHATMVKKIASSVRVPADVELSADPAPEWLVVYLSGLTPDRREIAPAILTGLPARRCYFACRRAGVVIASGLSVGDGRLGSASVWRRLRARGGRAMRGRFCPQSRRGPLPRAAPTSICRRRRPTPQRSPSTRALAFALPAGTIFATSAEM
jgi:N-acetylglutamate synthase